MAAVKGRDGGDGTHKGEAQSAGPGFESLPVHKEERTIMNALGEPRVPKPSNQGDARLPKAKPPLKGGNSQKAAGSGVTKRGSHRPGVGGTGSKNNPRRT
jgi:hypothetical protein